MRSGDTIFALSSGRLPAAIAVVRISGLGAGAALRALIGRTVEPRRAALATVRDPATGEPIDQALALWFPGPNSETGEDTAELQLHGGRAVVAATLQALGRMDGLRPAEAGEFTRRAFENGQIDLTRVEGLADLIGAETEAQRRQAFRQLEGLLGKRAEDWRRRIIAAQALVEAGLDFSDEGDVPADTAAEALRVAGALRAEIAAVLADADRGERLRDGLTVAIAGPPNAGKSSLFNWLAGREAAIVSPYPGTTRDVLELHLDIGGYPVTVLDTAGVRTSDDPVEREGIARAKARAAQADLIWWVREASGIAKSGEMPPDGGEIWSIWNKLDLVDSEMERRGQTVDNPGHAFFVSALTGAGLAHLLTALQIHAETHLGGEPALVTRLRHRGLLEEARAALARAPAALPQGEEVVAEELRAAADALGRLLGRIDVEHVLDAIFRDFCIGK